MDGGGRISGNGGGATLVMVWVKKNNKMRNTDWGMLYRHEETIYPKCELNDYLRALGREEQGPRLGTLEGEWVALVS